MAPWRKQWSLHITPIRPAFSRGRKHIFVNVCDETLFFFLPQNRAAPPHHKTSQQTANFLSPVALLLALNMSDAAPAVASTTEASSSDAAASLPRMENTVACLPIAFGSVAFYLGNKADENNTHQWTLYLRGPNNEDLSACIEKVIFQLHASFPQPLRELTSPPYEVTERGWGEFEAQIRIIWKDPNEQSTYVSVNTWRT